MAIRINEIVIHAEIKHPSETTRMDEGKEVQTVEQKVHSLLDRVGSIQNKKRRER